MFTIDKVRAVSDKGEVSEVTFGKHLNIIYGPSNCGKTLILKCIDYLLGAKNIPFSTSIYHYSKVEMDLSTANGQVKLSRVIGASEAQVISNDVLVRSGTYKVTASNDDFAYGQLLLGLLGIQQTEPIKIFSTKEAVTAHMSIRTITDTFIIREEPIISEKNIYVYNGTNPTALKSAILFMLYGKTYITGEEKTPKWMAEKKAMRKYFTDRVKNLTKDNDWLEMPIFDNQENNIRDEAEGLVNGLDGQYDELQAKYNKAMDDSGAIAKRISELTNKLAEDNDLLTKFGILHGQYESDIARMRFIIEGKDLAKKVEKPDRCPFCNGELTHEKESDCIEAAKGELSELLPKLSDLEDATKDLKANKAILESQLEEEQGKRTALNDTINQTLKPKMTEMKEVIRKYGASMEEAKEKENTRKEYQQLNGQIDGITVEINKAITSFDPDTHFGNFGDGMSQKLKEALGKCHFPGSEGATFNVSDFDIHIGQNTKGDEGKGYRAFLNSICSFTMHDYLLNNAIYSGTPYIVDSPILSLKEINEEKKKGDFSEKPQEMKGPLFQYFLDKSDKSQTIIIENDYPNGVNYGDKTIFIHYTKDPSDPDHYGFLKGVR
jgi:hypothetical protein